MNLLTGEQVSQFWISQAVGKMLAAQDRAIFEMAWHIAHPKPSYIHERRKWREWKLAYEVARSAHA